MCAVAVTCGLGVSGVGWGGGWELLCVVRCLPWWGVEMYGSQIMKNSGAHVTCLE